MVADLRPTEDAYLAAPPKSWPMSGHCMAFLGHLAPSTRGKQGPVGDSGHAVDASKTKSDFRFLGAFSLRP